MYNYAPCVCRAQRNQKALYLIVLDFFPVGKLLHGSFKANLSPLKNYQNLSHLSSLDIITIWLEVSKQCTTSSIFDCIEPIVYVIQEGDVWYFVLCPLLAMFSSTRAFYCSQLTKIKQLVYLMLIFCDFCFAIMNIMANPPGSYDIW